MDVARDLAELPLPPSTGGLPWLGDSLAFGRDPMAYLVEKYREYGPVFEVSLPGEPVVVLAGVEANRFANKEGKAMFASRSTYLELVRELGSDLNMIVLEGEQHELFRRAGRVGYSKGALNRSVGEAVAILRRELSEVANGQRVDAFVFLQRAVSLQLGVVATQTPADEVVDDLVVFMRTLMLVYLAGLWPKAVTRMPRFRRVKARALAFAKEIVDGHRDNPPTTDSYESVEGEDGRARDLIDDFLDAHAKDPDSMPMDAVYAAALGPFLAGQDTVAGTTAFMLHAVLTRPQLLERARAEADALFAAGTPSAKQLQGAKVLRGIVAETLRRFPVAPLLTRRAAETFEFAGHRVEAGRKVFIAQTLTHFLSEHFDAPLDFEVERGRAAGGTLAPFGVGPHTCPGAGLGERLAMLDLAVLLHTTDFELPRRGEKLRMRTLPPAPKDFMLRMRPRRA